MLRRNVVRYRDKTGIIIKETGIVTDTLQIDLQLKADPAPLYRIHNIEISRIQNKYLKDPDEDSYDHLVKLGLVDHEENRDTMKQRNELISYMVQHLDKKNLFRKRFVNDIMDLSYDLYEGMWK